MRRALLLIPVGAAAVVAVILIVSHGGGRYRVAAVFDTAKGMVAGQQVKVAGAVVGTVDDVQLAPGPKARIVMSIDHRFAPFRADATCTILPEGLISENYVQCDPGKAAAALPRGAGGQPTVGVAHTTVPVSLQDVLNVFALPTDQRLRVFISELGIGLAGRGGDLNGLLLRANPSLAQARRLLAIVDAQRHQVADAVGQTEAVLGRLGDDHTAVRGFVDRAATVAATTAEHSGALGQTVHDLPAMLDAVQPGLRSLDRAAASATPLLDPLRASAPDLRSITQTLPAFANAGRPALRTLASAAATGRRAVVAARPVVAHLKADTPRLATLAGGLDELLKSLRDTGGIEGLLRVTYAFANNTSLYDNVSHILTFMVSVAPGCIAGQQAGLDVQGCSRKYSAKGGGQIPVNEPQCGAKSGAWWDQKCPVAPPSPITFGATAAGVGPALDKAFSGHKLSPAQIKPLLDYLLKR